MGINESASLILDGIAVRTLLELLYKHLELKLMMCWELVNDTTLTKPNIQQDIMILDYPNMNRMVALRISIETMNDKIRPNGSVLSYLVFRCIPRFPEVGEEFPDQ